MASKKISALPSASSLSDSDAYPAVQAGVTVQVPHSLLADYIYQKKFIGTDFVVATFADLPAAADNSGKLAYVTTTTGSVLLFTRKTSGFYRSNGTTWATEDIPYRDATSIFFSASGLDNVGTADDVQEAIAAMDAVISGKVTANGSITGATKTKVTYDAKGLVTGGADATTADIADSSNKRYVTDAQLAALVNLSGTNTGDQTTIVGITGTKAQFDTACGDGNFLYVGDISQYTDEMAQDAVGAMIDGTLLYTDALPYMGRAAITGDITIAAGSNTAAIASGVIVNADINSSAGIALSKLAATTASRAVVTDASGFVSAASVTATELGYLAGVTSAIQTQLNGKQATGNYITTLTGDVTASGPGSVAATLATVNSNVGSFGSATQAGAFTVNAKGLVTAASNVTVTPAVGSITGLGAGVSTFLATPTSANLAAAVTDETGSGALVFGTSPTFTTQITTPLIRGSASASGTLTLSSTSHATKGNILLGTASAYTESNDRLGIGTTSPSAKLHVSGGRLRIDQSDGVGQSAVLELTNGTHTQYWFNDASGNGQIRTDSARPIIIQDASSSSGGLGVGGSPSEKLHVFGNILASGDVNASNVNVDNALINGGFDICQRIQAPSTETAFANNTYTLDRWYLMTDGGSSDIQCSRQAGDTNSRFAMRVKQTNASAKKWAVAQIIEGVNTYPLRNKTVRFQARIKSSSTPNMRMAILEWSGAVDIMGSARDLINAWANSGDANPATTFFKSTSITVRANIAATATSGSFADFSVTATVGATATNLIVVFWTPSAISQNVSVDITQAGLYQGTNAKGWYPRPLAQELAMCQRYCYQMWRDTLGRLGGGSADTTSNVVVIGTFPVTMRATPTLASSTAGNFNVGGTVSSFNVAYTTNDLMAFNATTTSPVLTIGTFYQLTSAANNQFLRFEAEL